MQDPGPSHLHLTRRDPVRNMARFYVLDLQPTLFGEVALVRTWGRIGSSGRAMMVTYPAVGAATAAADRLTRQKRGRGYRSDPD